MVAVVGSTRVQPCAVSTWAMLSQPHDKAKRQSREEGVEEMGEDAESGCLVALVTRKSGRLRRTPSEPDTTVQYILI